MTYVTYNEKRPYLIGYRHEHTCTIRYIGSIYRFSSAGVEDITVSGILQGGKKWKPRKK